MDIETILFDVGGVLIQLDAISAIDRLLGKHNLTQAEIYDKWMSSPYVIAHETGQISAVDFAEKVVKHLGFRVSPEEFLKNFCLWPSAPFPGVLELIDQIPGKYELAILSNTSRIHWARISEFGLTDRFHHTFLSFRINALKPDSASYLAVIRTLKCKPQTILFLDDNYCNVTSARLIGLKAEQVHGTKDLRRVLSKYEII